ncbi:SAM-dependent methyltransferase [Phenylobacterium deserti]|uniref:SAM-dependent methyltransferase n=1 Tax=Phenylobacterium deserti TaxID=1914756 RepID=UPI0014020004|nr:SAM-dependent methyltransferase [Phenylobacterium deserti]
MAGLDVADHLRTELAGADPWSLATSEFERRRFDALLSVIAPRAPFGRALEVGCAAGVFTARLAPLCTDLTVVDAMPQALDRAAERLGPAANRVAWRVADPSQDEVGGPYDLIVAAEVLYYLPGVDALKVAAKRLASALRPGGILVFGSASDEACRRWGLYGGAETGLAVFSDLLREVARTRCLGADWTEDSTIVAFSAGQG